MQGSQFRRIDAGEGVDRHSRLTEPPEQITPRERAHDALFAREFGHDGLQVVPLHVGGGYGGDPDWSHGMWKGEGFTGRRTYDMTSPDVAGRIMFGVLDHVARAVVRESGAEGWGLLEHGALGRHDPSGFPDWFTPAP